MFQLEKNISRFDKSLRPYQGQAKKEIFEAWIKLRRILFQMPTGTGKTKLVASIISDIKVWSILHQIDFKVLIVAHRIELIEQISDNLYKYEISHGIIAGREKRDVSQFVQVASIQTISNYTNSKTIEQMNVQFIIVDEAHHSVAGTYQKLFSMFPEAKVLGVTATPWRMDGSGFYEVYNKLILSKSISEFIKEGWLSAYNFYSIKACSVEHKKISTIHEYDVGGDYKTSALEREMDTLQIRARLLDSYQKIAKGKKGIIYSISRKHSEHICEEYRKAGINIVKIDGLTPREERKRLVQKFRNGEIDIIVNVDIFSEGFDCPDIEFIQLAKPTRSLVKYLQQVGRGLRRTNGKGKCIILDNVGASIQLGMPDSDRDWESFFRGNSSIIKKEVRTGGEIIGQVRENSFEEGTDELILIESAEEFTQVAQEENLVSWSGDDEKLLKILYSERNCAIELISAVLKKETEEIRRKLASKEWQLKYLSHK